MSSPIADGTAAKYLVGCAGSITTGVTIGQVNEWLQAGAFIAGMLSGAVAAYYYWQKNRREREKQ